MLLKQPVAEPVGRVHHMIARLPAKQGRDIREGVEGCGNAADPHTFYGPQASQHHVAPRPVPKAHAFDLFARAFKGSDGRALHELVGAGGDGSLHANHGFGHGLDSRGEAQPPAGHGKALGESVDRDGALAHAG